MSTSLAPEKLPAEQPDRVAERPKRLLWRRRMLIFSIPLVLLVLLFAAKLLSVPMASAQLSSAFAKGDAGGVHSAAGVLKIANFVEPYKAWFNDGDGYLLQQDFEAAKPQFEEALRLASADDSCKVRVNLAFTLEKLGDAKKAAGDESGAKALYDQGVKVTDEAPQGCFQQGGNGNQQGEGQNLKDANERLKQKSQGTGQSQTDPSSSTPQPSTSGDPAKIDQLNQQQKQAQKDRNDGKQGGSDVGNLPQDPNGKQW
ncbi:tetratricopeptide (TPR) repeat protein [Psychromicrobium silvestre]|uniref:Tetratricopeptide (TPR) repeat protein n=1 Tax=Psychromicrobium silvestre TaxID=1645614 RepID=A0A7Y9LRX1_9MICC|nr:hypothetical protein [Psychromicrobium silvestre]NYE94465.1 tetratricopeptide (TPR) repeat protein [Psychromicrobium silvestre]